jgi:hypothetical protein
MDSIACNGRQAGVTRVASAWCLSVVLDADRISAMMPGKVIIDEPADLVRLNNVGHGADRCFECLHPCPDVF